MVAGLSKNKIIEGLFTGKNFCDCINRMDPEHLRDDLKQEIALIICEWPDEKIKTLYEKKELEFYVVRVILNQAASKSSPFYRKFRMVTEVEYSEDETTGPKDTVGDKGEGNTRGRFLNSVMIRANLTAVSDQDHKESLVERELREELEDYAISEIDQLYWYDAEMVRLYLKHKNYRAIEKATGIPYSSCFKTVQKAVTTLRNKSLNHNRPLFSKSELKQIAG